MICYKCGQELPDKSRICPNCRADLTIAAPTTATPTAVAAQNSGSGASLGLKIVSFLFPLIGIILFFTKKNEDKTAAKSYLKMALISIALGIIGVIVLTVGSVGLLLGAGNTLVEGLENGDIQIEGDFDIEDNGDYNFGYDMDTEDGIEFEEDIDTDVDVNADFNLDSFDFAA